MHRCIAMPHTTTGSIYLSNTLRAKLVLNSVEPAHRVLDKAEAYAARTGKMIYVPGLGEIGGTPPKPLVKPTIGVVSITGTTAVETGSATDVSVQFDGKAADVVYDWRTSSTEIAIVGAKNAMTVQVSGVAAGTGKLTVTLTSATATDSPKAAETDVTVTDPAVKTAARRSSK